MQRRTKIAIASAGLVGAIGAGTGVAVAGGAGDGAGAGEDATETPIAGSDLDKASAVALDHTGEGRVTGTEVGDEESYYEVEVTLDNGSEVDVQLDESFAVVGNEAETGTKDER